MVRRTVFLSVGRFGGKQSRWLRVNLLAPGEISLNLFKQALKTAKK
jgi:hypothetical protein